MILNKKNNSIFFLSVLALLNISCNFNNTDIYKDLKIKKVIDFKKGFSIKLQISPVNSGEFKTKNSSDGIPAKDISFIKSYSAFLTTDFNDPFASGANPLGDNVLVHVNTSSSGTASIVFPDIKRGGPYFAVISAFDDVVGSSTRNNLTKPDLTIISTDKNWSRSNNSVLIKPSGDLQFSDNGTELVADLSLSDGTPLRIGFQTNILDGSTIVGPINPTVN